MLEKIVCRTYNLIYESLEELESSGVQRCKQYNLHAYKSSTEIVDEAKLGAHGKGDVIRNLILNGWPELHSRIRPMADLLALQDQSAPHLTMLRKRKKKRSDSGDELDMHRVYSGQLSTAWTVPKRTYALRHSERHVTLYVNVSANWNVSFDQTLWRAACALKICDMVQAAGKSLEVYVGQSTSYFSAEFSRGNFACRVKQYVQPLEVEKLVAMSTAGFLRTYGFLMIGSACARVYEGMGHACDELPHQLLERREAEQLIIHIGEIYNFQQAQQQMLLAEKLLRGQQ